jgi:anaerobic selenocysteine-containing dehydrogenase
LCADWRFPTPDGKAHFSVVPIPKATPHNIVSESDQPTPALEPKGRVFVVSTRRGKQFNTLVYAEIDPLNGAPRDAVLMNALDAIELALHQHDRVVLANEIGRFEATVFLAPIARGNLQIHWPEGNVLIKRGVTDPAGGVPDYNARVRIQRIQGVIPAESK